MPLSFTGGWQAFVFNEQDQGSFECHHVCIEERNCAKLIVAKSKLLSLREHWSATCLDFGKVFLL